MLSNAATIAVAGVGGAFGAAGGTGDAGVSTAACRPAELASTVPVPVAVDGAVAVDVPVAGDVVVLPSVVDGVVGIVVVVEAAVVDVVDVALLVVGAACRGPDDDDVGVLVDAGSDVAVWFGALEPLEPAGEVDTPAPDVEVVVDDGAVLVEVEVGADDAVVVLGPAPALAVSAGAALTGCPPVSEVTGAVSAAAVPVPAAHAPAIATAPPASFAARTQLRLVLIDIPHPLDARAPFYTHDQQFGTNKRPRPGNRPTRETNAKAAQTDMSMMRSAANKSAVEQGKAVVGADTCSSPDNLVQRQGTRHLFPRATDAGRLWSRETGIPRLPCELDGTAMPQEWAVVGRDRDLAEITTLIEDPMVGGIALVGAAGVGKSRLAREIAQHTASNGWTVHSVSATVTSGSVPMGAFARWTDDRGGAPASLVRRVGDALVSDATVGTLLVVVDDAHLLDDLSALVVDHLADFGATLLLTVRSGEPAPTAITALWKERRLLRREIEALSPTDVTEALARAFGAPPDRHCAQRFWDMTRGNMLYVRQLAEQEEQAGRLAITDGALRWEGDIAVRGSLAELVEAHIGDLPEPVRDIVDLVAVSEPIEWRVVATLCPQIAIEEAEQRGLIRITDGQLFVGHPLFAEVRRAQCGSAKLRRLRGMVATSMDNAVGAAQLIKRGLLWLESDLAPDGRILQTAATAANSLLDFDIAERLLAAATQARAGADAHVSRAWTLFMMSEGESVERVLADAPSTPGDTGYVNDVVMRAMNAFWTLRSPDESHRIVDKALSSEVGARRQQILVFRAMQYALAAQTMAVLDTLDDIDTAMLDPHGMAMTCLAECKAAGDLGRLDQVVSSATTAVQSISRSDIAAPLLGPVTEVFTDGLATSGRIHDAMDVADQFHRSRHSQPAAIRTVADQILGMAHLAAGDLLTTLRLLPARFEPSDWAGRGFLSINSFARFHLLRAQALARLGDANSAATAIATARPLHHPGYAYYDSWDALSQAWLAAAQGRVDDACQSARAAADIAREHDQPAREVWALQNAVHFGDRTVVDRLGELAVQLPTPRSIAAARYAIALVGDDADGLLAASERFESIGDRLAAAEAAAQSTLVHRHAGSASDAMTMAARTRRLSVDCGGATSPAIALATARLEPPFTSAEREIVMLVARGATNREIAQLMSLSVRTVESHIYRASRKAGVTGRAGLRDVIVG